MALTLAAVTAKLTKLRYVASGLLAVLGTATLTFMFVQQYKGHGFHVHELWFLGLMFAVTFEAIATFLRPEVVGGKVSIWSLTLMGCSCVFGGFVMRQGLLLALGLAMIIAGYIMAVALPNGAAPASSDNAAR